MNIYRYKRTYVEFPWRYWVYVNDRAVGLTLTAWGARRLIKRLKKSHKEELKDV